MRRLLISVAAVVLMLPVTMPAQANTSGAARMDVAGNFTPPLGHQLFCLTNPQHCRGGGANEIKYSEAVGEMLVRVNASVNRSIQPQNDRKDVWSIGVSRGDCEEYALAKRAELIRLGLPASAVRIAMAKTRRGEGHAVVVVRTDVGDLVLDNLTGRIRNWDETGLRWIAMSGSNGRSWQQIR